MLENKGDLWKLSISSIFNGRRRCISKSDVRRVAIQNGGNDGWKIESIVTELGSGSNYIVLTTDIGFEKVIDGNLDLKGSTHQVDLTLVFP